MEGRSVEVEVGGRDIKYKVVMIWVAGGGQWSEEGKVYLGRELRA